MVNRISPEKRSHIMSCIRSKDTKVEWMLRSELWRKGFRYRTHYKITGKPDIVFTKKKIVVFIDGDFWHGYDWSNLKKKLKNDFWHDKIKRNMERDKEVTNKLKKDGWKVIRIWEHELRQNINKSIKKIERAINKR